jgi:acetoin utilization protein AcuB
MQPLTVSAVMTETPYTVLARQSLGAAQELFARHRIRHLPVLEDGALVGVLSSRDLGFLESTPGLAQAMRVKDVMTPAPYTVGPHEPLDAVASAMSRRKIGSAVVVDRGKVVGVFTTVDALRLLSALLAEEADC